MKLFKYDEEKLSYKLLFYGKTHRMVWLLLFVLSLLIYLTFRVGHYFGDYVIPKHQNNTIQYEKELFVIDTLDVFSEKNLATY